MLLVFFIDLIIRLILFGIVLTFGSQVPQIGPAIVAIAAVALVLDWARQSDSVIRTILRRLGLEEKTELPRVPPTVLHGKKESKPTGEAASPGSPEAVRASAPPPPVVETRPRSQRSRVAAATVEGAEPVLERAAVKGTAAARPIVRRTLTRRTVRPTDLAAMKKIGEGGEAVVFRDRRGGEDLGLKMFRFPGDPFYAGDQAAIAGATTRLAAYDGKLPQFPPWLGSRVVGPVSTLHTPGSKFAVCGYAMPFVADAVPLDCYSDRDWKSKHGVTVEEIARVFIDLHDTICELHAAGLIIGDFKMPNVLVQGRRRAFIVDAESMAYGDYPCRTFTEGFVDPRLCDPVADFEVLVRPYDRKSDWYAFSVMLFTVLTHVMPYDGVYMPPAGKKPVMPGWRSRKSISVFNQHVRLPNFTGGRDMPEKLKTFFFNTFERGLRERPGRELLELLLGGKPSPAFRPREHTCWTRFNHDGVVLPGVSGDDTLPTFATGAQSLVAAAGDPAGARHLLHDGAAYRRENGAVVVEDGGGAYNTFVLGGSRTIVGVDRNNDSGANFDGPFYILEEGERPRVIPEVDPAPDGTPNIAFLGDDVVWVGRGSLVRLSAQDTPILGFGEKPRLFSGDKFGVIITTNQEELSDIFLFDKIGTVRLTSLPPILGKVKRVQCVFGRESVWIFFTLLCKGETSRYVMVLNSKGDLLGLAAATDADHAWFSEGTLRAAYDVPAGAKLGCGLAALTQLGLVRLQCADQFEIKVQSVHTWKAEKAELGAEPRALVYTSRGLELGLTAPKPVEVVTSAAQAAGAATPLVTNGQTPESASTGAAVVN